MEEVVDAIREWRRRNLAALWITEACDPGDASNLLKLDWPLAWSALRNPALEQALATMPGRYHIIRSRNKLPPEGRVGGLRFLYDVSKGQPGTAQARRAAELENLLEGWAGALVVAGNVTDDFRALINAFAPNSNIFVLGSGADSPVLRKISDVVAELLVDELSIEDAITLDLKDARGIKVNDELLEPLRDSWELLTRDIVKPRGGIEQEDLDAFLSGDNSWSALAAGVSANRGPICESDRGRVELSQHLVQIMRKADRAETDPSDAVRRVRLFAETGSGCTTLLRQAALAVARAGYPVLVTRPVSRSLLPKDVARLIVQVQDAWATARKGKGSGTGTLPFCLILDADVELAFRTESFGRSLFADLNRKILIVTAHRRSRDEIDDARGTLKLRAKTSKKDILKIGNALRAFSSKWSLAPIPNNAEWEAYYASFGRLKTHIPLPRGSQVEAPALFLIGLYPFVKARVRDERSLSRYLYHRWAAIGDVNRRRLIEVLAVAAAYGCAVPLECLRDPALLSAATTFASKADERAADVFVDWATFGSHTINWALHMRHPGLGILLIRALLPLEAQAPFSPLLPIIAQLVGTKADIWFCEELAYRLGRNFQRDAQQFSLLSDTPIQAASRSILESIPESVQLASRIVCHHHARYYVHLLHACLHLLNNPGASSIAPDILRGTALNSFTHAERLLEDGKLVDASSERISNLLNTLAAASLRIAEILIAGNRPAAMNYSRKAINLADEAVADNLSNGHAIFTYIHSVQKLFAESTVEEIGAEESIRLFGRAEARIQTLIQLTESNLWRNIEDEDAEIQVTKLVEVHKDLARRLDLDPLVKTLTLKTPEARASIALRGILEGQKLGEAFRDQKKAAALRDLRDNLARSASTSAGMQDLQYRLFAADPIDRFNYESRYNLLDKMMLSLPEEYPAYLHDHAAIAFQLNHVDRSDELFEQIRHMRIQNPNFWTWYNERIYVRRLPNGSIAPQEVVVRITDPIEGWATYDDRVRVKIQPRQWGDLQTGTYRKAYLRFRLLGLQAVDKRFAEHDLVTMGIDPANESTPT